jgi:hypothetical protein
MDIEIVKPEVISLKQHPQITEKWLQDKIEEDPSILGLGDLTVYKRERKQSAGGRIDLLLLDTETQTMYETEIMLGTLDESHIIRAIEYWDIERRRFLSKDHVAVIIAEEITNRFFNVIALLNRTIPIIAIQLSAIKYDDKIMLNFTRVLDIYEEPEEEETEAAEAADRSYWENKANERSLALFDHVIKILGDMGLQPRITYNRGHIAIGTLRKNFAWFHPRKKESYCHFDIRVGEDNVGRVKELLENSGIGYTKKKRLDTFGVQLRLDDTRKSDTINQLFKVAWQAYE